MTEEEKDLINLKIAISPEKYIQVLLKENQTAKQTINELSNQVAKLVEEKKILEDQIEWLKQECDDLEMQIGCDV